MSLSYATALLASCTLIVACAGDGQSVCDQAQEILAECSIHPATDPFATCDADAESRAKQLIQLHDDKACAGVSQVGDKADGAICSVLSDLCVKHTVSELKPFVSDGCSMFPDGDYCDGTKWQQCCIEHDFAYYIGGSEDDRQEADRVLDACVSEAANGSLGELMYWGVRIGGHPGLPTPWRWGYGWEYDALDGYRIPPPDQVEAAQAEIDKYRANPVPPNAFEQRFRNFELDLVPGLQEAVDDVVEKVNSLICD